MILTMLGFYILLQAICCFSYFSLVFYIMFSGCIFSAVYFSFLGLHSLVDRIRDDCRIAGGTVVHTIDVVGEFCFRR